MRIVFLYLILIAQHTFSQTADTNRIKKHYEEILNQPSPRNHVNVKVLNNVAAYIHSEFEKNADSTYYQPYRVGRDTFKNVICSFGTSNDRRLIIGAHYDVCGNQDGADDNASGTIGLLELSRLLKSVALNVRVDLVAYTLEEPPFFRSKNMGSYKHASFLYENNIPVEGMICLEIIGYFNDDKGSQEYPVGALKLIYGSRGNYITVVQKMRGGRFARKFNKSMKSNDLIRTKSFKAPKGLAGIDFSDHLNYWGYGYSAVMITNTAFYRNKNYHQTTDKIATIDFKRMAAVITSVYQSVHDIYKSE